MTSKTLRAALTPARTASPLALALTLAAIAPAQPHGCGFTQMGTPNSGPLPAGNCCELSIGRYRVWVEPQFRSMMAGVPGWEMDAPGVLTSTPMTDRSTLIAHSTVHLHGDLADVCGTTIGTSPSICHGPYVPTPGVSDGFFTLQPPGFQGPPNIPEVHLEIVRMCLCDPLGLGAWVKAGQPASLNFPGGNTYVRVPPPSYGEAQAGNAAGAVAGGRSFFNVFVEVGVKLNPGNVLTQAILYNKTPLVVQNGNLDTLPPSVAYLHENSSAVPVFFAGSNGTNWLDGDLFGFLVLSGHGVGHHNPVLLDQQIATRPPQPVPEGGAAGPSGPVGVSLVNGPVASTAFNAGLLLPPVTSIHQVGMVPHPNGGIGVFLGGMTVRGLPIALGGAGGFDVVSFTYDRLTDVVTLDARAAAFNTAGDEFALNWARDGSYAVCDRFGASPVVLQAKKKPVTSGCTLNSPDWVLDIPRTIIDAATTLPFVGGVDPNPGEIGGQRVLFFNDASTGGISYRRHDLDNRTILASPATVSVTLPSTGSRTSHSCWPIQGGDGDTAALIACEFGFAGPATSRWNFQGDLKPNTAPIFHGGATNAYEFNGCEAGGRVYMPADNGTTVTVYEWDVVFMTADRAHTTASGGSIELMAISGIKPAAVAPDITVFMASAFFLPFPLDLTPLGLPGQYWGLDLSILINLGAVPHSNASGKAFYSFPVPSGVPANLVLPIQGLTLRGTRWYVTSAVSIELF